MVALTNWASKKPYERIRSALSCMSEFCPAAPPERGSRKRNYPLRTGQALFGQFFRQSGSTFDIIPNIPAADCVFFFKKVALTDSRLKILEEVPVQDTRTVTDDQVPFDTTLLSETYLLGHDEAKSCLKVFRRNPARKRGPGQSATNKEASDLKHEVATYFSSLAEQMAELPRFLSANFRESTKTHERFDQILQVVHVEEASKPIEESRSRAIQRMRAAGQDVDALAYAPRKSLVDVDGEEDASMKAIPWTPETSASIRRGVILGDPGSGKTWLLKQKPGALLWRH